MKRFVLVLGAIVAPLIPIACGGQGAGGALGNSPEADAVRYRQGIMRAIQWKVTELRSMADGETALDEAQFKESAGELAALATMIPEGFIPNSAMDGSAAKAEIWSQWDTFVSESQKFAELTRNFANTAEQNGFEAAKGMAAQVGGGCRTCHSSYRARPQR